MCCVCSVCRSVVICMFYQVLCNVVCMDVVGQGYNVCICPLCCVVFVVCMHICMSCVCVAACMCVFLHQLSHSLLSYLNTFTC